jgi:hypothetical protein
MVISPKDPMMLATFTEVIAEIKFSLAQLKLLATEVNFDTDDGRKRYYDNIAHLKRFYERAERIALDEKAR